MRLASLELRRFFLAVHFAGRFIELSGSIPMLDFAKRFCVVLASVILLAGCQTPTNNAKLMTSVSELQAVETIFVPGFSGDPNYGEKSAAVFANALETALAEMDITNIQVLRGTPRLIEGQTGPQSVIQGKAYSNHNNGFFEGFAIVNLNRVDTGATQVSISRPSKSKRGDSRWGVLKSASELAAWDLATAIAGKKQDK